MTPSSCSKVAHDKLIDFSLTVSQQTLRQTNDEDREALHRLAELDSLAFRPAHVVV